jgi:hypothetical protein
VPDIVGRIGPPASLAIFTEGNHLMALLSDDIVGAFPAWAKSQPQYADLDLDNIVVVTVPQPVVEQMIRTGGIALGNLILDVNRKSSLRITSWPAATAAASQPRETSEREQAEYMAAHDPFADSQIPLAPRAPSIHGRLCLLFGPSNLAKVHVLPQLR